MKKCTRFSNITNWKFFAFTIHFLAINFFFSLEISKASSKIDEFKSLLILDNSILSSSKLTFENTLRHILKDGTEPSNGEVIEFARTLLNSFNDNKYKNLELGDFDLTVEKLPSISELIVNDLFDPLKKHYLFPTAVVNRFDLAPDSFTDCGEYRIVYSLKKPLPAGSEPVSQIFIIFEARVPSPLGPNSTRDERRTECRKIARFWADLSRPGTDIARKLEEFFYRGSKKTGPRAIRKETLGIADGQIRGTIVARSAGGQHVGQMREWWVQTHINPGGNQRLVFRPVPLANSPLIELYQDYNPSECGGNSLDSARCAFQNVFFERYAQFLIDPDPDSDEIKNENWFINNIALPRLCKTPSDDDKRCHNFTEFQNIISDDSGFNQIDYILMDFQIPKIGNILKKIEKFINENNITDITDPQQLLQRAQILSCGGCHQFETHKSLGSFGGQKIEWPANTPIWHISEPFSKCPDDGSFCPPDAKISGLLTRNFIPFRKSKFLSFINENTQSKTKIATYKKILEERNNIYALSDELKTEKSFVKTLEKVLALGKKVSKFKDISSQQNGAFVRYRRSH